MEGRIVPTFLGSVYLIHQVTVGYLENPLRRHAARLRVGLEGRVWSGKAQWLMTGVACRDDGCPLDLTGVFVVRSCCSNPASPCLHLCLDDFFPCLVFIIDLD